MLTSLSLIFLVGLAMGAICQKIKLPRIIGMLATGASGCESYRGSSHGSGSGSSFTGGRCASNG